VLFQSRIVFDGIPARFRPVVVWLKREKLCGRMVMLFMVWFSGVALCPSVQLVRSIVCVPLLYSSIHEGFVG